jgi:hypothetical protein
MSQSSSTGANAISGVVTTDHPTAVLVHGLLDDARIWDEVAAEPAWQSLPVELGDVPVATLGASAEHLAAIVDNDIVGDVTLVGQSMASQVAEFGEFCSARTHHWSGSHHPGAASRSQPASRDRRCAAQLRRTAGVATRHTDTIRDEPAATQLAPTPGLRHAPDPYPGRGDVRRLGQRAPRGSRGDPGQGPHSHHRLRQRPGRLRATARRSDPAAPPRRRPGQDYLQRSLAPCRTAITGCRAYLTIRDHHLRITPVNPLPTREIP